MAPTALAVPFYLLLCAAPLPGQEQRSLQSLPVSKAIDQSWFGRATAELAQREYAVSAGPQGAQATNRAQELLAQFGPQALEVRPRTQVAGAMPWRLRLETYAIGRGDCQTQLAKAQVSYAGNLVTYQRGALVERYENRPEGLEQFFGIATPPQGAGMLEICMRVDGATPDAVRDDGRAVDFSGADGALLLRMAGLCVFDANGAQLEASFAMDGSELAIRIDDRGAAYPLLVDPLMTNPAWTGESNQASAWHGYSVATAGDVNGDGYSDVVVGALFYTVGQAGEGAAFLYLGSASGLATSPAWTGLGNHFGASYGISVASAGDVNGDGRSDVIVGASSYDAPQTDEGRAFLYLGTASGLSATPAWIGEGNQVTARFGWSVAGAGDVNGDGFADVIAGSPVYDAGQTDEGAAFLYLGAAAGLAPTAAWTGEANLAAANYGISVSTAGDINADGYADVVIGAQTFGTNSPGAAFAYLGSPTGLAAAPVWSLVSSQNFAGYGGSVATAGDVNGDGYSDVLVGAFDYDAGQTNEGTAFLYIGSSAGLSTTSAWVGEGNQTSANYGRSVATAGDVNGDGYADVIVGADAFDAGETDEGKAFVYTGSASGLAIAPSWTAEGNQASAKLGWAVATAGDMDGNGISEVIVGAYKYDAGQTDEGAAFVYLGSAAMPSANAAWTVEGNQAGANFGYLVDSAGDVNGDGYSDAIVSTPWNGTARQTTVYYGSASGLSTTPSWTVSGASGSSAGDENGDGYSDVMLIFKNVTTGLNYAELRLGSPAGLSLTPIWASPFTVDDPMPVGDVNSDGFTDMYLSGTGLLYFGSQSTPYASHQDLGTGYGARKPAAGDVNADGFADIAFQGGYTSGVDIIVLRGSASGLLLSPSWSIFFYTFGCQCGQYGRSSGDVNGDGYSDVLVTGIQNSDYTAQVRLGSAMGPSQAAAWYINAEVYSSPNYAYIQAASAGDVNGDGFADVLAGQYLGNLFYPTSTFPGSASIYLGSPAGPSTIPAWYMAGPQAKSQFGNDLANAGDVNGDGYSDVIVGAPLFDGGELDEGAAYLYLGNGSLGLPRFSRQLQPDGTTPIALGGKSSSLDSFSLRSLGRTPLGRGRIRFEYEVKPLGTPFNGSGLLSSAFVDTGIPGAGGSAVPWSVAPVGLPLATYFHWRVRTQAASPLFPRSPWMSLPSNGITESKLRTKGVPVQSVAIALGSPSNDYCVGTPFSLQATSSGGTPPIGFQWHRDGLPIPGANAAVYAVTSAAETNAGIYDCTASNWEASVTSNAIPIAVNIAPPDFTLQPVSVQASCGGSIAFSVAVTGSLPQFQWRRNFVPIAGATSSTLTLNPLTAGSIGVYDCIATNSCGSTTSQQAVLSIGLYSLALSAPLGPGSLRIQTSGGPPGYFYAFVFSFDAMNAIAPGLGWWSGLWTSLQLVNLCVSIGAPPFVGFLNASGGSLYTFPAGTLSGFTGMTMYGVTSSFNPSAGFNGCGASNVASLLIQ